MFCNGVGLGGLDVRLADALILTCCWQSHVIQIQLDPYEK